MHIVAHDLNRHRCRIEVFTFQLTHATAINGIGPFRVKGFNIKELSPLADFLIRCKRNANIAVWNVVMFETQHSGHNFGDTGFIVGTQQGFAVGSNQRLT